MAGLCATNRAAVRYLIAGLMFTSFVADAADNYWQFSGIDEFYQQNANWSLGVPASAGDIAIFDVGGAYNVLWNAGTGDTASDAVNVLYSDVSMIGIDGPHTHSVSDRVLVDSFASLTLDQLILTADVDVVIGDMETGALTIHNNGALNTASIVVGADSNLGGYFSQASVQSGGQLNAGSLMVGANSDVGFGTAQVDIINGGALNAVGISVAEYSALTITEVGTTAEFSSLITANGAYVQIADDAIVSASGTDSGIIMAGGTLDITNGAVLQNLQSIFTTTGLFTGTPDGDSTINVDGPGTRVELTAQSATGFTGLSLGFGHSSAMNISGGAVVEIGESGAPGLPSGFVVGQDVPEDLGGATFGSSSLVVQGPGSQLVVSGAEISAAVGSSTATINFFEQIFGFSGLDNPGGTGTLEIFDGGVVALNETPGGSSGLIVGDTVGASGTVIVSGPGSILDAGQSLQLGAVGGHASVDVNNGGQLIADNVSIGQNAALTVSGPGTQLNFGEVGTFGNALNVSDGSFTLENGAVFNGAGPDSVINLIGGNAAIRNGAQALNLQTIFLFGAPGSTPDLVIDGAGTVVDLTQQSLSGGTGLLIGFGNDASATVSGGAVVEIGDTGLPGFFGGFTVGTNIPVPLGGPQVGMSQLTVDGPGSRIYAHGDSVGGSVGSGTAFNDFFGLAPADNPGGHGSLYISNGGAVIFDENPGGNSALIVADTANATGYVQVWGVGSMLDAGQLLALGVDAFGADGGNATLDVYDGGHVVADHLQIGSNATANLWGGTLTVDQISSAADNFNFFSGVLNVNASNLSIGAGGLFGDELLIDNNRELNVAQDVIVDPDAILELAANSLSAAAVINHGDTIINANRVASGVGLFENNGRIVGNGRVDTTLVNNSGGEVRATGGDTLRFTQAGNINSGEINIINGAVEFSHDVTNNAGGFIGGRGIFEAAGGINNQGVLAFTGVTDLFGDVDNNGTGQVIVSGGTVLTFFDDVVHNGLEIRASTGSKMVFLGALSGAGPFTGGGDFFIEGDLRPGNSPGLQSFIGNVTFGALNNSVMELGGLTRATQYDAIDVTGTLTLGGDITIELVDLGGGLFAPGLGDVFNLFDASTLAGSFANVFLPGLASGLVWDLSALNTLGEISVAAVPLPGAVWMLLSAAIGLGLVGRRRNQLRVAA